MPSKESKCSKIYRYCTKRGLTRFYVDVRHDGLNKYRRITGDDSHLVMQKAHAQMASWDEMWERKAESQRKESQKFTAEEKTKEAKEAIEAMEGILVRALEVNNEVDWDTLRDHSSFTKPKVYPEPKPPQPALTETPARPAPVSPRLGLLDYLIPSRRDRKEKNVKRQSEANLLRWQQHVVEIKKENEERKKQYTVAIRHWQQEEADLLKRWEKKKQVFLRRQQEKNAAVDSQMEAYAKGEASAMVDYCDLVLSRSQYPDTFPQDYEIDYNPETKTLVVDYQLPSPAVMPAVKEVKYIKSRDEFVDVLLDEKDLGKLYDKVIYQITLRTLHELFDSDAAKALQAIAFNGIVTSLDKAIGKDVSKCIVSMFVKREEFMAINLARVEPKSCFRSLKGIGSAQLHGLAPVAPILQMTREDKRFVQGREVIDGVGDGDNIAAMDWEDFEHMIRELFEKEFAQDGSEVKVTRASRDGGVDAVVFDPDPIHGGKMVVQAKRYTNTVGLSAVRDLYGTVINEGATKGILVTTADYGPEAYHFAKDKPLTLLNGGNLLHLLQKHGYKAKIDLKEAKQILGEQYQVP